MFTGKTNNLIGGGAEMRYRMGGMGCFNPRRDIRIGMGDGRNGNAEEGQASLRRELYGPGRTTGDT